MRERNKIILEYGTYMLSFFVSYIASLAKWYYASGIILMVEAVCTLGKGKWKPCGTEGSVYTCLGRGPGNQLSETQYITGYMELYNLVELFCDIYSFWNRI